MSAYSTLYITRRKAKEIILDSLLNIPDDILASVVDKILEDRLYRCIIVENYERNDDKVI